MRSRSSSGVRTAVELLAIVVAAVALAWALQAFVVKPYKIPSGSMEPTLAEGQRILVDRIGMRFDKPHVGEIVVFHPPEGAEQGICGPRPHTVRPGGAPCSQPVPERSGATFVKRIVAGPGDTVDVREGRVYLNGRLQREPWAASCHGLPECDFPKPITVEAGHWFMMGDNRGNSEDSRFWGPVPTSWIVGEAFFTYWPLSRLGTL